MQRRVTNLCRIMEYGDGGWNWGNAQKRYECLKLKAFVEKKNK